MTMNEHPPSSDDVQPEPPVPPVEPEPIPPIEPGQPAPPLEPEPIPPIEPEPIPPIEPGQPAPPVEPGPPEPPVEPGLPHPPTPPVPPLPPQPGLPEPPQVVSPDGAAPAAGLPSLRPTQLPRTLLIGALTTAGISLGATLVAGILLALAAFAPLADALGSMSGGSSASLDTGVGVIIGLVFVSAGLVLGGEISAQLGGSSGMLSASGGGSAWLFPLLLTLAVLVATAWWSWRIERRDPQQGVWHRLIASAAAGLVASLVLLLLVALLAPRVEEAGSSFLVTSAGFRLAAVGTVLLTGAGFLGRELAQRTAPGEGVIAAARRNIVGLPAIIREPLALAAVFAVVFTPLAIVGGVVALVQQDMATAIPLLIVLCLNAASALAVVAQLGGIEAAAGTSGFGGVSELVTVFSAGQWWLWVSVLIALLAAVVAAIRIGVRRPRAAGIDLARLWQLPAGAFAGWLAFALLLFGASASGSGNLLFFAGDATVSLSIAWWSLLVLLVWAAAVSFGAAVLPAVAYGLSPRLLEVLAGRAAVARWLSGGSASGRADGPPGLQGDVAAPVSGGAGPAAPPAPPAPPAPMSPRAKKALAWTGGAVAVVAVLGIGGAITLSAVNASRGPVAAVQQYVGLIADGRAEAASALVDPNVSNAERAFLADEVLSAAAERITDVEVSDEAGEGDLRYVEVTYRLDGVEQSASLEAERLDNEWLVLERWRVATPLLTEVFVYANGGGAQIGGVDVPLDESGQATVAVYPGVYDVEPASTGFFEADPVRVTAGATGFGGGSAELDFRPTAALQEEVEAQVKALIDGCAEQTAGQPEGCPFQVYVYPDDTPVTWSIASYPTIEIAEDGTYFTASGGVAEATYIDSGFFSDDEEVTDERDISFSGGIEIDDDAVAVTSDGYWW